MSSDEKTLAIGWLRPRFVWGQLRAWLFESRFLRNVGMIAGGTAIGQLLLVAASPILTHLYTPQDYGLLALFTSIVYVFMASASLHYEVAIALPSNNRQAVSLVFLSLLSIAGTSLVIAAVLLGFGNNLVAWASTPELKPYLWMLPATILAAGVFRVFFTWGLREQAFGAVARSKLTQSVFQVFPQVILGFARVGTGGLLAGVGSGFAFGSAGLVRLAWRNQHEVVRSLRLADITAAARQYSSFAVLGAPATLFSSLGASMPVFILAGFYDAQVVGWFALAQQIIGRPLQFVAASVAQVFYSEVALAARQDTEGLSILFMRVIRMMTLIAVPFVIGVVVLMPFAFTSVFGSEWAESLVYIRILAVMFLVEVIVSPTAMTLDVVHRQDLLMLRETSRLAALLVVVGCIWQFDLSPTNAVMLLSAAGVASHLASVGLSIYAMRFWQKSRVPSGLLDEGVPLADWR